MVRAASFAVVSVLLLGSIISATLSPAFAGGYHRGSRLAHSLVGYWEGVDVLDGSTINLSIADYDGDRVLDFRYTESFFSVCFNATTNTKGRGYLTGTVTILNRKDFELTGAGTVCVNDDNTQDPPMPFTPKGSYARKNDIIVFPDVQDSDGNFLHRTSSTNDH